MFMDEERDERYVKAAEANARAAQQAVINEHERRRNAGGWRAIGAIVTTVTIFVPASIILWRAALGF